MGAIKIDVSAVLGAGKQAQSAKSSITAVTQNTQNIKKQLDQKILTRNGISNSFSSLDKQLKSVSQNIQKVQSFSDSSANKYYTTEQNIRRNAVFVKNDAGNTTNKNAFISKNTNAFSSKLFIEDLGNAVQKQISSVKNKFVDCLSSATTYIYENKDKIISYGKATLKAAGGVAKVTVGVASIFASGGLSTPAAVLSCVSGINDIVNSGYDIAQTYNKKYEKVGSFNALKDGLSWTGGKIGEALGSEKIGSGIGKGVYYASELYVSFANFQNAYDKVKQLDKTNLSTLSKELKDLSNTKINLKDLFNSDVSQLKLDYALLKYKFASISNANQNISTIATYIDKGTDVVKKTNKVITSIFDYDNLIGKAFDSYDERTEYKKYTYGGIKKTIDTIHKNNKIISDIIELQK